MRTHHHAPVVPTKQLAQSVAVPRQRGPGGNLQPIKPVSGAAQLNWNTAVGRGLSHSSRRWRECQPTRAAQAGPHRDTHRLAQAQLYLAWRARSAGWMRR